MKIWKLATLVLLAVAVALALAPATGAKAGEDRPTAESSIKVGKKLKRLKGRIASLERGLDALGEQGGGPRPPTGPAGGDLTGTFPRPLIGPNAVSAPEIADDAIGSSELAPDAVGAQEVASDAVGNAEIANDAVAAQEIATDAVGTAEIANDAVTSTEIADEAVNGAELLNEGVTHLDLAPGSVRATEMGLEAVGADSLKPMSTATSAGTVISAGGFGDAEVSCGPGEKVLGGGFAWQDDEANSIIHSVPSQTRPNRVWTVRGMVPAGSNTLYAWANCLPQ